MKKIIRLLFLVVVITFIFMVSELGSVTAEPIISWKKQLVGLENFQIASDGSLVVAQTQSRLQAFNKKGTLLWQKDLSKVSNEINNEVPIFIQQYLVLGNMVIFSDGADRLIAVDFTGQVLWEKDGVGLIREIQASPDGQFIGTYSFNKSAYVISVLNLNGDKIWEINARDGFHIGVGSQGSYVTLGTPDGFYIFRNTTREFSKALPLSIVEGDVYSDITEHGNIAVMVVPQYLYLLNENGQVLWEQKFRHDHFGRNMWGLMKFVSNETMLIAVGNNVRTLAPELVAFNMDGSEKWRFSGKSGRESISEILEVPEKGYLEVIMGSYMDEKLIAKRIILDYKGGIIQETPFPYGIKFAKFTKDGRNLVTSTCNGELIYYDLK